MNIINSILSFLLGADYEILQLCPTEYSKQRKRIFVALIIAVISYVSAGYILKQGLSAVIALLGIGLVAVPTGIISAGFIEELSEEKESKSIKYCPYCGEKIDL